MEYSAVDKFKFRRWNLQQFTVKKRRLSLSIFALFCRRKTSDFTVEKCCNMPSENVGKRCRKMTDIAVGKYGLSPSIYVGIRCR